MVDIEIKLKLKIAFFNQILDAKSQKKLASFGVVWRHLASFGVFWRHLASFGVVWRKLVLAQRKNSFFSKNNRTFWLKVFGNMAFEPDSHYNRHNHFQTFMAGLLVLFRWVSKMQLQTSPANFPHPQTPKIKFLPQCTNFSVPQTASIKIFNYKWQLCGALSLTNFECSPLNVMFSQYNFSLYYLFWM